MKKYVDFKLVERKPKTNVYWVVPKGEEKVKEVLGKIYWHFPWRQYIFEPISETIWSRGCMLQVLFFLEKLMEQRKKKERKKP